MFIRENEKNGVYHKAKNGAFHGIVDRDFLTDDDIAEIEKQYATLNVLRLYSIENYLYHPDNLEEYFLSQNRPFDKDGYIKALLAEKNSVPDIIKRKLALIRTGFPFFKEPEYNKKPNQNRFKSESENYTQVAELENYLNSDLLENFYKIFPMKDYATQLPERQNIPKTSLAKIAWFAKQIQVVLA